MRSPTLDLPSRPRLVVVGDLLLDVVATAAGSMVHGSDVAGTVRFRAGGSAANTARAFARLGGRATLVGAVGADEWGRRLAASLRADGVAVRAITVARPTGRLVALVEADGERSFVTERAAADLLSPSHLVDGWLRGASALHLPGYSIFTEPVASAAARAASLVRAGGGIVSVDLSSRGPLLAMGHSRVWDAVAVLEPSVLFGTAAEMRALLGRRRPERSLQLAPLVVIKQGAAGCRILAGGDGARPAGGRHQLVDLSVATRPVSSGDSTGAGDAFAAGFLFSLLAGADGLGSEVDLGRDTDALRRAALAGHSAARTLLTGPRPDLTGA